MKKIILLFLTFIFINLSSYSITEKYFDIEKIKKDYSPNYDIIFNNKRDILAITSIDFNISLKVAPTQKLASAMFERLSTGFFKNYSFLEIHREEEDRKKKFKIVEFTITETDGGMKFIVSIILTNKTLIYIMTNNNSRAYVGAQDLLDDLIKNYSIKTNNK